MKNMKIDANGTEIRVMGDDFIFGLWEQIHNPNFKPIEFDRFKAESGDNAFTLTPQQWIKATDAIGIVSIQMR